LSQQEYIGFDSIRNISSVLNQFAAKRIFLVTGTSSYYISGAHNLLKEYLSGHNVTRYCEFSSNPKIEDVIRGIGCFKSAGCDAIIAVGGGSVIDMAKLVTIFAENNINPVEYIKKPPKKVKRNLPIAAIPTTAGSGSEATGFAVLYIDKKKYSIENSSLVPDVAIIDPGLMISLPKYLTAVTGMDALCQAVESYWSVNSNEESKAFAAESIRLIKANIVQVVNTPDTISRQAMAEAAHLSGKAINITRTTAPHAISYPLTSYFGIPHGHAAALTLPAMLEYMAGVNDKDLLDARGCRYVRNNLTEICCLFGSKEIIETKKKIEDIIKAVGLETRLSRLGITSEKDIQTVIDNGFDPDRVKNNPRRLTREALREILESIN
jgi:alcohol dehydrogenase